MKQSTNALVDFATNVMAEVYLKAQRNVMRTFFAITFTCIMGAASSSANAATFTVTSLADSGSGTLRQAVLDANAAAGADTIEFAITAPATIILTSGPLTPSGELTINGNRINGITISANNSTRVIQNTTTVERLTLNYLNITEGKAPNGFGGGGVFTAGPLFVNNCAIFNNHSPQGTGGGIHAQSLLLNNSTVSGNSSSISGGGIQLESNQSTRIQNSTIAFNTSGTGGGVHNAQSPVRVKNTIIAKNSSTVQRPDYSLSMFSEGYNLIGNTAGVSFQNNSQSTDQLNVEPFLQVLTTNFGATRTHRPLVFSPVLDAGDPAMMGMVDQRGTLRGADGNIDGVRGVDIGAIERQKVTFDFDQDERANPTTLRVVGNTEGQNNQLHWYFKWHSNTVLHHAFGLENDKLVPADYDGDGVSDMSVYRNGDWYIEGSSFGLSINRWGLGIDTPVPADYDGDGKDDLAVYRSGQWHILGSQSGYVLYNVGTANDKPVPADYDGDGKADMAVFNAGTWTIRSSAGGVTSNVSFGQSGDLTLPGDYNGDGRADLAVYRPSNGTWYITHPVDNPAQNFYAIQFGISTDKPVPADYDSDGKMDVAVFRSGTWWILNSRIGLTVESFGYGSDRPLQNAYVR